MRARADLADLDPVAGRLAEVVAEQLFVLTRPVARDSLEPAGKSRVPAGAQLLRDALVRGLPDQDVAEPIGVLARQHRLVGAEELLALERPHRRQDLIRIGAEGRQRSQVEHLALDRGPLDHAALGL